MSYQEQWTQFVSSISASTCSTVPTESAGRVVVVESASNSGKAMSHTENATSRVPRFGLTMSFQSKDKMDSLLTGCHDDCCPTLYSWAGPSKLLGQL